MDERSPTQTPPATTLDGPGVEWIVEARGCDAEALRDVEALRALFERIVDDLRLRPVRPAQWHAFPGHGGVTGLTLLAESHLACHTFPEHRSACLNLFCCRPRPEWDFRTGLVELLGATDVDVRRVTRSYAPTAAGAAGGADAPGAGSEPVGRVWKRPTG